MNEMLLFDRSIPTAVPGKYVCVSTAVLLTYITTQKYMKLVQGGGGVLCHVSYILLVYATAVRIAERAANGNLNLQTYLRLWSQSGASYIIIWDHRSRHRSADHDLARLPIPFCRCPLVPSQLVFWYAYDGGDTYLQQQFFSSIIYMTLVCVAEVPSILGGILLHSGLV